MSADLMLVTEDENFSSTPEKCVKIDETSMGEPHTDFGKLFWWLKECEVTEDLIQKVLVWFDVLDHKDSVDIEKIVKWLEEHRGEYISMECW